MRKMEHLYCSLSTGWKSEPPFQLPRAITGSLRSIWAQQTVDEWLCFHKWILLPHQLQLWASGARTTLCVRHSLRDTCIPNRTLGLCYWQEQHAWSGGDERRAARPAPGHARKAASQWNAVLWFACFVFSEKCNQVESMPRPFPLGSPVMSCKVTPGSPLLHVDYLSLPICLVTYQFSRNLRATLLHDLAAFLKGQLCHKTLL